MKKNVNLRISCGMASSLQFVIPVFQVVEAVSGNLGNFHSTLDYSTTYRALRFASERVLHTFARDDARILPIHPLSQYLFSQPGRGCSRESEDEERFWLVHGCRIGAQREVLSSIFFLRLSHGN